MLSSSAVAVQVGPSDPVRDLPALSPLLAGLPADGAWTLAGGSWAVTVARLAPEEVETWLSRPAPAPVRSGDAVDEGQRLLALSGGLGKRVSRGCEALSVFGDSGLRIATLTQTAGGVEHLRVVRAVLRPSVGGAWSALELMPGQGAETGTDGEPGLLPRLGGEARIAARKDRGGRLLGEVLRAGFDPQTAAALWQSRGWQVRPLPWSGDRGADFMCSRPGEDVRAWFPGTNSAGGANLLVLTVVPGGPVAANLDQRGEVR
jgi:hypothetical protein